MKLPNVKKPCKDCPFRKDTLEGWLGKERITSILNSDSFTCHKTTSPMLQCAGHMILLKNKNSFYSLANAMKINLRLTGHELIFETKEDCIKHHS